MAGAEAGVVGQVELNSPQGTPLSKPKSPAFWTWLWFGVAVFIVMGFHVRVFGVSVPSSPALP